MAYSGIFMKIITIRLIIFERNDLSSIILTLIAISLFIIGKYSDGWGFMFYISIEITLYGLAYFFVHDIFIHQRFKLFMRRDNFYFPALRKAHKVYRKHRGKQKANVLVCYSCP